MNYIRIINKKVVFCFYFTVICCFMWYWESCKFRIVPSQGKSSKHQNAFKTILLWNDVANLGWETRTMNCHLAKCIYTTKRDYLPQVDLFDAIFFYSYHKFISVPQARDMQQLYVFTLRESQVHTHNNLIEEAGFYNITMTHRLDSDIINGYGEIVDKYEKRVVAPSLQPKWRTVRSEWTKKDAKLKLLIEGKKKLIAWFVSNCETQSHREEFVRQLKEYIDIDIYGYCGKLNCTNRSECREMLGHNYKFYLSFENSFCTDYVTEKFFNALEYNVVPIVFGGANYTYFAPPHSYIDARSFRDTLELVDYIKYLNRTVEEYARFFWWTRYYKVQGVNPHCRFCDYINSFGPQHRKQFYTNISEYWYKDRDGNDACQESEEF